jgi:hypothetical protein
LSLPRNPERKRRARTAIVRLGPQTSRDDATHYFHTVPRFETAEPKYAFLNRLLAVGIGEIRPDGPVHLIEEIL